MLNREGGAMAPPFFGIFFMPGLLTHQLDLRAFSDHDHFSCDCNLSFLLLNGKDETCCIDAIGKKHENVLIIRKLIAIMDDL